MTEPVYLAATRSFYDTVAESYAEFVKPVFPKDVMGRAMLSAFAELVPNGPVADLGCGPGHVTAYLDSLGMSVFGVDLSPTMVAIARLGRPDLRFEVGSMTALDLPDGELAGILAWYSIIHTPPIELPVVFAEFRRTLAPGGQLLVGFHVGDEALSPKQAYGHPVSYQTYLHTPERITELLGEAGITVTAQLVSSGEKRAQARLLASKPVIPTDEHRTGRGSCVRTEQVF